MCLLIAKPAGVEIPNLADLCEDAHWSNPDGFGLAYRRDDGLIQIRKGLWTPDKQAEAIQAIGDGEAILHWRFGTSGSKSKLNCHPFILPDDSVFAHNGILPVQSLPSLSDTHTVAQSARDAEELEAFLLEHVGRSNKFCIMRPHDAGITILGEEFGYWVDGVWFSNMHWKPFGFQSAKSCKSSSAWEREHCGLLAEQEELDEYLRDVIDQCGLTAVKESLARIEFDHWLA